MEDQRISQDVRPRGAGGAVAEAVRGQEKVPGQRPAPREPVTPVEVVDCPTCGAPAEVRERVTMCSTGGPVEHARVWCSAESGHKYFAPLRNLGMVG